MFFPIAEHRSTSAGTRSSEGLRAHGLLKVRQLGIEAIVSLSGPARRNDKKNYWNYVRGLAKEAGVDAEDPTQWPLSTAPRKGRKCYHLGDPDARVGSTKDGACDMIYKPEHIVDLESGAIIAAAVRPGDAGGRVEEIHGGEHREGALHVKDPTGDKGFHSPGELAIIQESAGLRIIIREPQ